MSIFAVASGKGGVGKSCIAAYTAAALAATGKRVLLVEPGFSFRALDIILGVSDEVLFDFSDVAQGRCDPPKAIVSSSFWKGVSLLSGPLQPILHSAELKLTELILREISSDYDAIIVDGVDFEYVSPSIFKTIILVVTPDFLAVRAESMHCNSLVNTLSAPPERLRLIINNVPARIMPMNGMRDFDDIIDMVGARLIGVIPHSPNLQYSSNNAVPLKENSLTLDVFDNIAARLMGQNRTLLVR